MPKEPIRGPIIGFREVKTAAALTIRETIAMLERLPDKDQAAVFSSPYYGDFDLLGDVGSDLSQDNFDKDRRPILRIRARHRTEERY